MQLGRLSWLAMTTKIEPWRAGHFDDGFVRAHRTFNQTTRQLRLKIFLRTKPAFKGMLLATLKIKNFHDTAFMARIRPVYALAAQRFNDTADGLGAQCHQTTRQDAQN